MVSSSSADTEPEMLLLVMLPVSAQCMIIQTPRSRSIGALESYIQAEYARVFPAPAAAPLPRHVRIQKCVPITDHRRPKNAVQEACFVELSKTVSVGNVFENMEQIYVVTNEDDDGHAVSVVEKKPRKKKVTPPSPLPAPPVEKKTETVVVEPKKRGRPRKNSVPNEAEVKETKVKKPRTSIGKEEKEAPVVETKKPKKKKEEDAVEVEAEVPAEVEVPKKKRGRPPKVKEPEVQVATDVLEPAEVEMPKRKRGRPPKVKEPELTTTETSKPTAMEKKARRESLDAATETKSSSAPKVVPRKNFQQTLAALKERIEAEKRAKDAEDSSSQEEPIEPESPAPEQSSKSNKPVVSDTSDSDSSAFEDEHPPVEKAPEQQSVSVSPHETEAHSKQQAKTKEMKKEESDDSSDEVSSDEEELDYSQNLLAELSHSQDEVVAQPKKHSKNVKKSDKKAKATTVTSTERSEFTPKKHSKDSTETHSVLVSTLAKNKFSLNNIPIAKLKPSSKNPFANSSSTEAPKRSRGRPRKVKV